MTIQLNLVYNSITVDLQADGRRVMNGFYPRTPKDNANVVEQFEVWIRGSTIADRENSVRAINRAFEWAREHPEGDQACKLYWAMDSGSTAWYTVVQDGFIDYDAKLQIRWNRDRIKGILTIEHTPGWEGAETAVPLTNGNGTDVTAGINVYSNNDGSGASPNKKHNYVDIDGDDIVGDLPGRTRIEITNLYATALHAVWIGQNWTDPANAVQVYEAESATGETPEADATCSNGNKVTKTVASGSEQDLFTWTLSSAAMSAAKGQTVHALARFVVGTSLANIRFGLQINNGVQPLWYSAQAQPESSVAYAIRDLAQFRLPPYLRGMGLQKAASLILTAEQSTGSNISLPVDFLALVPADGWRHLRLLGSVAQNSRIVDDGINRYAYMDNGTNDRLGNVVGYGDPIALQPARDQRLYFWLHTVLANTAPIDNLISLKVYYRPRRSVL